MKSLQSLHTSEFIPQDNISPAIRGVKYTTL